MFTQPVCINIKIMDTRRAFHCYKWMELLILVTTIIGVSAYPRKPPANEKLAIETFFRDGESIFGE